MYAVLEEGPPGEGCGHETSCKINSLAWMGNAPDDPEPTLGGWKLDRFHYYERGWLAVGNELGTAGVTCTSKQINYRRPPRENFNLRGHKTPISLVLWNEPYQKLVTVDFCGVIFVWMRYEGRWSVELINDRSVKVRSFSWSHSGRMAVICYDDGFVLVGSVGGQRFWSMEMELEEGNGITCASWSPDDNWVYIATSRGQITIVSSSSQRMDSHQRFTSSAFPHEHITTDFSHITQLCWSKAKSVQLWKGVQLTSIGYSA